MFYLLCEKSDVSRLITPPSQMQLTRMVFKREEKKKSPHRSGRKKQDEAMMGSDYAEDSSLQHCWPSSIRLCLLLHSALGLYVWNWLIVGGRMEVIMPGDGWSVKKAKTFIVWMNVFGVDKILFVPFFFISFFFLNFFENIWTFILNKTQKSYRSNEYHLPLIRLFEFYKSPFNLV